MHKRLFMLAALLALFALSTLAGHAFADTLYSVSMPAQCNPSLGYAPNEYATASLTNQSGGAIQIKRMLDTGGGLVVIDANWLTLSNNTADQESYIRHWPTDIVAVGWTVQNNPTGVSASQDSDACRY